MTKAMAERSLPAESRSTPEEVVQMYAELVSNISEKKSFNIFTFGKTGSGKSTLGKAIIGDGKETATPEEHYGWDACLAKPRRYECKVGNVAVAVIDTLGLFDANADAQDDVDGTVRAMGLVFRKDEKSSGLGGVIIVCIDMHERLDESSIKPLAALQQKFGSGIWAHVIIALTKADRFEAEKWLEGKPRREGKAAYLKRRFEEEVSKRKKWLKTLFTRCNDTAEESADFAIGLTPEQYDELKIPIIPTSELKKQALTKMDKVGQECWFDELLVECCARENDVGILAIHTQRMAHLPRKVIDRIKSFIPQEFMENALTRAGSVLQWARDARHSKEFFKRIPSLFVYCVYWKYYIKKITSSPRFQVLTIKAPDDREQKHTTESSSQT